MFQCKFGQKVTTREKFGALLIGICIVGIGLGGMMDIKKKEDQPQEDSVLEVTDEDKDDQVTNVILSIVFALLTGCSFTHGAVSI